MTNKTYHASLNMVFALLKYASSLGLSPDALCASAHLSPEALKNAAVGIPIRAFGILWEVIERQANDDHFGLHLAEATRLLPSGDVLLPVLLNSPTLGDALEKLSRYHDLATNFVQLRLSRGASEVRLTWVVDGLRPVPTPQQVEAVLYLLACMVAQLSDDGSSHPNCRRAPSAVCFRHARPADTREHQRLFNCPLIFDQAENELVIRTEHLALPIRGADPALLQLIEPVALKRLETRFPETRFSRDRWASRVRAWMDGQFAQGERPTLHAAAGELLVSERQLQDRLKTEGVTYQRLLDEARREIALDYLTRPDANLVDLAFLLGFAEQSAFNHAFKRWTGSSPREYRQRAGA